MAGDEIMLKPYIKTALAGENLSRAEATEAMGVVMQGAATPAQIAAWLVALRLKGETVDEIVGFVTSMRAVMQVLPDVPDGAVDTCGTGGDGLSTFNISTTAALITAACGVPIAKHGNRAVSSQAGSADVLAALGFEIDPGVEVAARALSATGFAFLFAPRFHPAMKHALGPRREIGVRTVFNLLGPLCNPAGVRRQVIGVYDRAWMAPLAKVLGALGSERAMVISGADGADELLPTGENQVAEWNGSEVTTYRVTPDEAGVKPCELSDLVGGDAVANAAIIRGIANGETGPKTETALLNAGAALVVAGAADSITEGVAAARSALAAGRVAALLQAAITASQGGS